MLLVMCVRVAGAYSWIEFTYRKYGGETCKALG